MTLTDTQQENLVNLLHYDLQKMSVALDPFLAELIKTAIERIEREGVVLDAERADDRSMIREYAAWLYRTRDQDADKSGMPRAVRLALNNRKVKRIAGVEEGGEDDAP